MGAAPSVAANAATALPSGATGKVPSTNISLKDVLNGVNAVNSTNYTSMKNLKDNAVSIWSVSGSGTGATITATNVSSLVGAGNFSLISLSNYYWANPNPVVICYISPGTYTVSPPNYSVTLPVPTGLIVTVILGGGGGGASGGNAGTGGGGGGGSSASATSGSLIPYNTGSTVSITVGVRGSGGAAGLVQPGTNGGASSVTVVTSGTTYSISAPGGIGAGSSFYNNQGGPGGAGGSGATSTNVTISASTGNAGAQGTAGNGGAGGAGGAAVGMQDGWGYLANSTNRYAVGTIGQYIYAPVGAQTGSGPVTDPPLKTGFSFNSGGGGNGGTAAVNLSTPSTAGSSGSDGGVRIAWYYT